MPLYDVGRSQSLEVLRQAQKKAAAGEEVYSLAIGEPVYDTPAEIIEAAAESMRSGSTHYVSSLGIPEVREAISRKVSRKNGIRCSVPNTIFMSSKLSIYAIFMALKSRGTDEVLVPDPGYFYSSPAALAGITPVPYTFNEDYSLDLENIERKITPRTRAVVLNTPNNPTGKVFGRDELKELYDLCASRGIRIISDEAYEDLTYEKKHISTGSLEPAPSTEISIFTLSKSYSMTGWRAGYIIGSEEIISSLGIFMDHTVTCFPPFIQHASAYALEKMDGKIEEFRRDLWKKRELILGGLKGIAALDVNGVEGAFYVFPGYAPNVDSRKMAEMLLSRRGVAVLPGSAFGSLGENHLRMSFSGSVDTINEAVGCLAEFFEKAEYS